MVILPDSPRGHSCLRWQLLLVLESSWGRHQALESIINEYRAQFAREEGMEVSLHSHGCPIQVCVGFRSSPTTETTTLSPDTLRHPKYRLAYIQGLPSSDPSLRYATRRPIVPPALSGLVDERVFEQALVRILHESQREGWDYAIVPIAFAGISGLLTYCTTSDLETFQWAVPVWGLFCGCFLAVVLESGTRRRVDVQYLQIPGLVVTEVPNHWCEQVVEIRPAEQAAAGVLA